MGAIYAFASALKEPGKFVVFRILRLRWAEQRCNGHLVARWLKSLAGFRKVELQQQHHEEDADVGRMVRLGFLPVILQFWLFTTIQTTFRTFLVCTNVVPCIHVSDPSS